MDRWLRYMGITLAELRVGKRISEVSATEEKREYPGPIFNGEIRDNEIMILDPDTTKAYTNAPIKRSARENRDFVLIPHELWNRWEKIYGGVDIKRFTHPRKDAQTQPIDFYLQKVTVVVKPFEKWMPFTGTGALYIDRHEPVKELREKVERILARQIKDKKLTESVSIEKYKLRVWRLFEQKLDGLDALLARVKNEARPCIELDGKLLDDSVFLEELNLGADPTMLVEMVEKPQSFIFFEPKVIRPRYFDVVGGSLTAEEAKKTSHVEGLEFARAPFKAITPADSNSGRTGIENLGNTCYMNSGLQCLSNCQELTKYFLLGLYEKEINVDNPLGQKGEFAKAYASVVEDLWRGSHRCINALGLKKRIVMKTDLFRGYAQQDCQELILHILDGLHEDLNRIKRKPYTADKDCDGRPDEVLSKEQWEAYLGRNRSIIVDLFSGQFKSKILCPNCKKVSVKFDPFMALSVPIPQIVVVHVTFVYADVMKGAVNIEFTVSECTLLSQLTGRIVQALKLPLTSKLAYFAAQKSAGSLIHMEATCFNMANVKGELYAYEYSPSDYNDVTDKKLSETDEIYFLQLDLKYVSRGFISNTVKPFDRSMIIPVPKLATIHELRMMVFARLKPLLKLKGTRIASTVPARYAAFFQSTGLYRSQPYFLEIVNNRRTYSKYYLMTDYAPCEFCGEGQHSGNCDLNVSNEKKVQFHQLLRFIKDRRDLRLCVRIEDGALGIKHKRVPDVMSAFGSMRKLVMDPGRFNIVLDDCLELFSQEEQLDGDNMWYCANCKHSVQAMKKLSLYRLPRVLIIHLKRFKQKMSSFWSVSKKVSELVEYPTNGLDMGKFVKCESSRPGENEYDLFAVSNHYGGLSGGHYTATCYNPVAGKWLTFDDASVYKAASDEIVSDSAYVLFYHRVQQET